MTTYPRALVCGILISTSLASLGAQGNPAVKRSTTTPKKDDKSRAIEFCRDQALTRLKYRKTIEWEGGAKDEGGGLFLVVQLREAQPPQGDAVTQQVTCRVERVGPGWRLRLLQLFKE